MHFQAPTGLSGGKDGSQLMSDDASALEWPQAWAGTAFPGLVQAQRPSDWCMHKHTPRQPRSEGHEEAQPLLGPLAE